MKLLFFLFIIFLPMSCFAHAERILSLEKSVVLKKFFQVLSEESEAGYVFFDKKPLCIHGYHSKDVFAIDFPDHKQSVALREGARVWKQMPQNSRDFLVHIYEEEDPSIRGYIHVLVINIPLFHRVVNENLSLFQYVLGPAITSDKLLSALIAKNGAFHSLLKDDKVLVGEILGFGTQNSLYVSRIENILDAFEKHIPPFLASDLLIHEYAQEYLPFEPSFGFKSIKDELNELEGKITLSSNKLVQQNPEFIFGWLKDSKKMEIVISELENTQEKIQKILKSPTFLEEIVEKCTGEKSDFILTQKFQFQFDREEVNRVVAKGLWEFLQNYDYEYLPHFIEGMGKLESQNLKIDRLAWFPGYRREVLEAKENLNNANATFQSLNSDASYQCVVPQKVYYKILKNGNGTTTCNGPLIFVSYSVFSPVGQCIAKQNEVFLNLKNTIPGFAHGVKGMKIGEMREIFIHPSLAYGFDTSLEKCMYLRAVVSLLDIPENNGSIPDSDEIDLSFLINPKTLQVRDDNYRMALEEKGIEIARHLKKCKAIDLVLIRDHLKRFYDSEEKSISTTQEEQDIINRVHWNIYYGEM